MKVVEPDVVLLASPNIDDEGLFKLLRLLGVPNWETDTDNDSEAIVEIAGKLCYMSFATELNLNLTRIRRGENRAYIHNILQQQHGSVLEHTHVSFVFHNVSRVFTHELVRHRIGAYSQVSGRFVRSDEVLMWIPSCFKDNPDAVRIVTRAVEAAEQAAVELAALYELDKPDGDFAYKKKVTSAIRRILPNGLANHIMATYNHRTLRQIIQKRTSRYAEEEIRLVFAKVFSLVLPRFPAFYQDAKVEMVEGLPEITFEWGTP